MFNYKIISGLLLLTVVLTGCNLNQEQNDIESVSNNNVLDNSNEETSSNENTNIIGYRDYSPELLTEDKINILNFSADWCPNCQALKSNLLNSDIPDNINILEVDYDNSQDLKQKYGVTSQTTLVQVDANGEMINMWRLSRNLDDILSEVDYGVLDENQNSENISIIDNVEDSETENKKESSSVKNDIRLASSSNYREYSKADLYSDKNNIIFFHASYCATCRGLDSHLSEVQIPDGLNILKVDFDTSTELRTKYGVPQYHTFVQVDENGEMIKKWSGSRSIDDIKSELN